MRGKVDYEKAWKLLMKELKHDLAHQYGWRILNEAKKILKQCTEPQEKKEERELTFDEEADFIRKQVDFSDPNF